MTARIVEARGRTAWSGTTELNPGEDAAVVPLTAPASADNAGTIELACLVRRAAHVPKDCAVVIHWSITLPERGNA